MTFDVATEARLFHQRRCGVQIEFVEKGDLLEQIQHVQRHDAIEEEFLLLRRQMVEVFVLFCDAIAAAGIRF